MAEVVGLAASVIAVLGLTGKMISLGYEYMQGVKRAPQDLRDLVNELQSLGQVLAILQDYVDRNPQSPALQNINNNDGPLRGCEKELKRLQLKLEPGDGSRKLVNSLKWPFREKDTAEHISRIQRHKSLFMLALDVDHIALSKDTNTCVQGTAKVVKSIEVEVQDISLTTKDLQTESSESRLWRNKQDTSYTLERRQEVLKWLYPDPFDKKHTEITSKRAINTGGWLVNTPEFRNLVKEQPDYWLLWGYGIPGAGKTFLSSIVISHLQTQAQIKDYGVAYVYLDYKERDHQTAINVLASLAKQLMSKILRLPIEIEQLYNRLRTEDQRPSVEDIYYVLLSTAKLFDRVFLVFDAVDECDPRIQRKELLPLFHRLANDKFSIFLTSRRYSEDIEISFQNQARIAISAQKEDIGTYIQKKLDESPRVKRLVDRTKCQDRIICDLIDCAKGMFLLVYFHIERLCQQTTGRQILDELDKIKYSRSTDRPLDPTYDRAMETVREQANAPAELAMKVFTWLTKARRTLTIKELQTAVSIQPGRYELDEFDLPDESTLLDVCAGLVVIDETTNTIKLAHYTIQEYIINNSIIPDDADFCLAATCLTYLWFNILPTGIEIEATDNPYITYSEAERAAPDGSTIKHYIETDPFIKYAVSQLSSHLNACDENMTIDMVLRFCQNSVKVSTYLFLCSTRFLWGAYYSVRTTWIRYICASRLLRPIHLVSFLGHITALKLLLDQGEEITNRASGGHCPLAYALLGGQTEMVELLLSLGADTSDNYPLSLGIPNGDILASLSLVYRINAYTRSDGYYTVLNAAVRSGIAMVKVFLDSGIDTKDRSKCAGALIGAVRSGDIELIKLLLDSGIDPNEKDIFGSALHMATSLGNLEAVRLLLDWGADVFMPDTLGQRASFYARAYRYHEIARIIEEKEALSPQQQSGIIKI